MANHFIDYYFFWVVEMYSNFIQVNNRFNFNNSSDYFRTIWNSLDRLGSLICPYRCGKIFNSYLISKRFYRSYVAEISWGSSSLTTSCSILLWATTAPTKIQKLLERYILADRRRLINPTSDTVVLFNYSVTFSAEFNNS